MFQGERVVAVKQGVKQSGEKDSASTTRYVFRENSPDPGDHEWIDVVHDDDGRIVQLNWYEEEREPDTRRYQPVRWSLTVWHWRPRLRCWDRVQRFNDLYPGKPDHVTRDRVDSIPAELLEKLREGRNGDGAGAAAASGAAAGERPGAV